MLSLRSSLLLFWYFQLTSYIYICWYISPISPILQNPQSKTGSKVLRTFLSKLSCHFMSIKFPLPYVTYYTKRVLYNVMCFSIAISIYNQQQYVVVVWYALSAFLTFFFLLNQYFLWELIFMPNGIICLLAHRISVNKHRRVEK